MTFHAHKVIAVMPRPTVVAVFGLVLRLQCLQIPSAGRTSDYKRPASVPLLPLEHKLLARPVGASPHVPEQVHLSLAGSGSMAVSWLTYPQVSIVILLRWSLHYFCVVSWVLLSCWHSC